MVRSSVRSAGLALLLGVAGCGSDIGSSGTGARSPGINVAEAALQGGAGQIALQVSEGILSGSPNDVRALEVKGDALVLLGQYDDATAIYQNLLARDPNSIRANTGMGRIKLSNDPAAAAALFERVLKRDPKDLIALNDLGIARDLQGRHTEAQVAYRQALSISPDQDSAQVNLALSMAMSGQGRAAVSLLREKAAQPGASTKVRHDYAVVLAMAGDRRAAEQVLGADLSPDETRQVLDHATGTQTKPVRDAAPDQYGVTRVAGRQASDGIPPDVVQVPEAAAPVPTVRHASAALSAPPPGIVRPRRAAESDQDAPNNQPVNPIAAAVVNQRPLAAPIRRSDELTQPVTPPPAQGAMAQPPVPGVITPKVIAMPPVLDMPRVVPLSAPDATLDASRPSLPTVTAAPMPPVQAAPVQVAPLQVAPLAQKAARHPTSPDPSEAAWARPFTPEQRAALAAAPTPRAAADASVEPPPISVVAVLVPPHAPEFSGAVPTDRNRPLASGRADGSYAMATPAVQFAAAASEDAAHAFWNNLVQKHPDMLGQRQASVTKFERDGKVFWRVRTEGFASASDAQSLCAKMHAAGQSCFVPRS